MEKLIFIHIPKTAGATFRSILKKNYSSGNRFFIHDLYPEISLSYLKQLSDEKLNKLYLIAGHGSQYILSRTKQFKSVIFIRKPVNQIISTYYHIKRSPHNLLYDHLRNVHTLYDYFNYLKDNNGFNLQTFFLSRDEEDFYSRKRFRKINLHDYEQAIKLLENIDYVFPTELFDESLCILKKEFGWKNIYYTYKNLSKNRSFEEDDQDLIGKFRNEQKWDYQLYQYAWDRFHTTKNKFTVNIYDDVSKFEKKNRIYNSLMNPLSQIKYGISFILKSLGLKGKIWEKMPDYD
jgi:hypothetical protein